MPSFFNTVVLLCNAHLFWTLCRAFGKGWWRYPVAVCIAIAYSAVTLRPYVVDMPHGQIILYSILLWAGFSFIMAMWTGGRDILHLLVWIADRKISVTWTRHLDGRRSIRIALGLGLLAFFYSLYEADTVRLKPLGIKTDRLPAGTERLRIAVISDLHLTRGTSDRRATNVVKLINSQKPDIMVMLGDIVDDDLRNEERLLHALQKIQAPLGKFAVIGNHEVAKGFEQAVHFIQQAGFTILHGSAVNVAGIAIAGVDDPRIRNRREITETLLQADQRRFVLLLAHRPETPDEARGLFDLQLSGHTHGGQIWPVNFFTRLLTGHWHGLSALPAPPSATGKQSLLYISHGTGYYGPPVRFMAVPEVTIVDLYKE